jgi:hypothetical protein
LLRRTFGQTREKIIREWGQFHSGELYNLYSPSNMIRMIKSRRMRWSGNVVRIKEKRNTYRILVGKPEIMSKLDDIDIGGKVISQEFLGKTSHLPSI